MAAALALSLALIAGLTWLLQILRVGHHLLGSGAGARLLGSILLHSAPSLLAFACPLALSAAIVFTLGRFAATNQLTALRAAGATPLQLGRPGLLLALLTATLTLSLSQLEPRALGRLQQIVLREGARAFLLGLKAQQFHPVAETGTVYLERRRVVSPAEVRAEGFFWAQERPELLLCARGATLRLGPDLVLGLELEGGEAQVPGQAGGVRRVRFGSYSSSVDLSPALRREWRFLGQELAGRRAWTAPAACLALGVLATLIGLGRGSRLRLALWALLAVAGYHAALWGLLALGGGPLAGVMLAAAVTAAGLWRLATC